MPGSTAGGVFDKWKLPVASSSSSSLPAPPLRQRRAATSSSYRGLSYRSSGKVRNKEGKDVEILIIVDSDDDDDDDGGDNMGEVDDDDSLDLATMLRDSGKSRQIIRRPRAPSTNVLSNRTSTRRYSSSVSPRKSRASPYKHSSISAMKATQIPQLSPSDLDKQRSGLKGSDPIEISSTSSHSSGSSVLLLSKLVAPPVQALSESESINKSGATDKNNHLEVPTKAVVVKALYESSPKKPKRPKIAKSGEHYDGSYRPPSGERHRKDSTSVTVRPLRVPLEPGKYTLPPIDTPIHDWPQDRAPLGKVKVERKRSTRSVSRQTTPCKRSPQPPRIDNPPPPSSRSDKDARDQRLDHLLRSSQDDKKEAQDEELDLLGEFADFDFTAPDHPSPSAREGTPRTPRTAVKLNPSQSANITTPSRSLARISSAYLSPTHASTAKKSPHKLSHFRSSSRLAGSQSSRHSHSPRPVASIEQSTENEDSNRIAAILANAEAGRRAEEEREKEEQEDRKRRIDALLALPEQEDDEDVELSFGTILESHAPKVKQESERKSTRKLSNRFPPVNSAALQPKRQRTGPSPLDLHLRQGRLESRQGLDRATLDFAYRTVTDSRSPTHGPADPENPYPTPNSSPTDDEDNVSDRDPEDEKPDLDVLRQEGLEVDEHLIKEGQSVLKSEPGENVEWDGFWDGPEPPKPEDPPRPELRLAGDSHMSRLLCDCAARSDWSTMSAVLTQGATDAILAQPENTSNLISFLMSTVLCTADSAVRSLIMTQLAFVLKREASDSPNPKGDFSRYILETLVCVWRGLGAQKWVWDINTIHPFDSTDILLNREVSCDIICQISSIAAASGRLSSGDSLFLVIPLLVLSVNASTSASLKRSIRAALDALWPPALAGMSAGSIAHNLITKCGFCPLSVQVQILLAIGHRNEHSRAVSWFYASYLLASNTTDCAKDMPTIRDLVFAGEVVHKCASDRAVSHETTRDYIICLCEVSSKVGELALSAANERDLEQLEHFWAIVQALHQRISLQSEGIEQRNKSMLATLATTVRLQLDLAKKRRTRRKVEVMKGLRTGNAGQLKLALSM